MENKQGRLQSAWHEFSTFFGKAPTVFCDFILHKCWQCRKKRKTNVMILFPYLSVWGSTLIGAVNDKTKTYVFETEKYLLSCIWMDHPKVLGNRGNIILVIRQVLILAIFEILVLEMPGFVTWFQKATIFIFQNQTNLEVCIFPCSGHLKKQKKMVKHQC